MKKNVKKVAAGAIAFTAVALLIRIILKAKNKPANVIPNTVLTPASLTPLDNGYQPISYANKVGSNFNR
jgi:hypothetical protein